MEFTLTDAMRGHREDSEDQIVLTEVHKQAFVENFSYRCTEKRRSELRAFIDNLKGKPHSDYYNRIYFDSCDIPCQYLAGQESRIEKQDIRKFICHSK